jgi:hypothetical protein
MMTSSFMAGADVPAAAPAAPAAIVAGCNSGCNTGCNTCDPCAKKPCLFDKMKGRMGCHKKHGNDCCAAAPTCAPAPAPAPTCCASAAPACDTCGSARPNLLDRIKAKCHGKKHKGDCCAPACDGCAAAPIGPAPVVPANPPQPMGPKKTSIEGAPSITIPTPGALVVPSIPGIPVTPVTGNSPY